MRFVAPSPELSFVTTSNGYDDRVNQEIDENKTTTELGAAR
jgi:hypothetical protein